MKNALLGLAAMFAAACLGPPAQAETATLTCPGGVTHFYVVRHNQLRPWALKCTGQDKATSALYMLYEGGEPVGSMLTSAFTYDEFVAKLRRYHALK